MKRRLLNLLSVASSILHQPARAADKPATWHGFAIGAATGAAAFIGLNLLPAWRVRHFADAYETTGFPFTFRTVGGFSGIYEFDVGLLIADALCGLVVSAVFGWVAQYVLSRVCRQRRGFPVIVVAKSGTGDQTK